MKNSDLSSLAVTLGFNRETNRLENLSIGAVDKPVEVVPEPTINLGWSDAVINTRFVSGTAEIVGTGLAARQGVTLEEVLGELGTVILFNLILIN